MTRRYFRRLLAAAGAGILIPGLAGTALAGTALAGTVPHGRISTVIGGPGGPASGTSVSAVTGSQASHTNPEGDSQVFVLAGRPVMLYGQKMTAGVIYTLRPGLCYGMNVRAGRIYPIAGSGRLKLLR